MACAEFKKPMQVLWDEHRKLENELTGVTDAVNRAAEDLANYRREEFQYKEALDALGRAVSNNNARNVIKKSIDETRIKIRETEKVWEEKSKLADLIKQKLKNTKASIKELDQA